MKNISKALNDNMHSKFREQTKNCILDKSSDNLKSYTYNNLSNNLDVQIEEQLWLKTDNVLYEKLKSFN